ncbi:hypothetical protein P8452_52098 [Trifolium repens]|nr:hypothetical protein P8452_52098 [Trifolium repens]
MDDQEESVEPTVNKRLAPSALKRKLVHNSNLVPPATTTSAQQTVDEEHPADDPILPSDLEDPDEFLLVDKYNRTIIEPYGSDFQPQRAATNALTTIIHQNYQQPWLTWGEIKAAKVGDVPVWKRFFNAFKNLCTWEKRQRMVLGIMSKLKEPMT